METFSTRQTAVISAANKTVYWLFRVTDSYHVSYYWSTGGVVSSGNEQILKNIIEPPGVYDEKEWERYHEFRIINFSGITMRRNKSESGIHAPNDVSFSIINPNNEFDAAGFIGREVRICLVLDDGNGKELCGAWRFRINNASPSNQVIDITCEDFLQFHLFGVYPNTQLIDELYPSIYGTAQDTVCVPEPYGTCYIPLRSIYANSDRYYVLGPSTYTYSISEVRSPRECGVKITWASPTYMFQQTVYSGWKIYQPLIAGGSNGVFLSGTKILDVPTKFSRSDTASMTNPADIIRVVLRNMGVQDYDLDIASFDAAHATFDSWGLTWNFAFWYREDRIKVIAKLLSMCHACFVVGEKISLKVLSKTSQATITTAAVLKGQEVGPDTFKSATSTLENVSDGGYVAYQITGESQDEFIKCSVPAKSTTTAIDTEIVVFPGVQNTQHVQKLGTLYFQRKLLKVADVSFNAKGTLLALRPDDIITIAYSDYGGTYDVMVSEMTVLPDVSLSFKCQKFSVALDDWGDFSPGAITPSTTAPLTPYQPVISGPDGTASSGTPPNVLPGRLRVGDGTSFILLDPAPPIKVAVYEASTEKLRIGNLNGFVGVATNTYGFGVGNAAGTGFKAKITASELYLGSSGNYLQYVAGVLTLRGQLNADDIVAGSISADIITTGTLSASYISGGTLNCSLMTVSNLSASSITTGTLTASRISGGTLNCSLMTVSNLSAASISTGTLSAGYISGGTLNCSLMTVSNLNAGSITAGTLSASRISGGTLDCGTMTVSNLSATNITTGTLTASVIATGSLYGIKLGTGSNGVGTDNLITNAATKGTGTYSNSLSNFVGMSWVTVASLTITTVGGPVMIIGYALMYSSDIDYTIELAIYRGGTLVCLADVNQVALKSTSVTPCAFDSPAAGTYTYYLKAWRLDSGDGIYNRSLIAVEFRR